MKYCQTISRISGGRSAKHPRELIRLDPLASGEKVICVLESMTTILSFNLDRLNSKGKRIVWCNREQQEHNSLSFSGSKFLSSGIGTEEIAEERRRKPRY